MLPFYHVTSPSSVLSQISLNKFHSNDNIQQNNQDIKLMFRQSNLPPVQVPQIQFKKKTTTSYFNHNTSTQRMRFESPSFKNHSIERKDKNMRILFSNNASGSVMRENNMSKMEGVKRGRLVRAKDIDYKNSERRFQFSKNKVRNISQVKINKFQKEPLPGVLFRFSSKSKEKRISTSGNETKRESRFNRLETFRLQQFQFGKKLGSGKFGEVFLVRNIKTNYICAMKIITKAVILEQNFVSQLTKQLKIQMYLNHPNILKMYSFFHDEEKIYILLEYCSSGSLYERICTQPKLTQPQASTITHQILTGLDQLHYHKILHRDIKPQNILIQHGIVKIGDFGWATYYQQDEELKRSLCGTPLYLSPEILIGQEYDEKIDVWSVGIVCYEMIVCRNPWGIKMENHLIRIVEDEIGFGESECQISEKAKDFIRKVLNKDPCKRQEAAELLNHQFVKQE